MGLKARDKFNSKQATFKMLSAYVEELLQRNYNTVQRNGYSCVSNSDNIERKRWTKIMWVDERVLNHWKKKEVCIYESVMWLVY